MKSLILSLKRTNGVVRIPIGSIHSGGFVRVSFCVASAPRELLNLRTVLQKCAPKDIIVYNRGNRGRSVPRLSNCALSNLNGVRQIQQKLCQECHQSQNTASLAMLNLRWNAAIFLMSRLLKSYLHRSRLKHYGLAVRFTDRELSLGSLPKPIYCVSL